MAAKRAIDEQMSERAERGRGCFITTASPVMVKETAGETPRGASRSGSPRGMCQEQPVSLKMLDALLFLRVLFRFTQVQGLTSWRGPCWFEL
jgi:hypothetical protein